MSSIGSTAPLIWRPLTCLQRGCAIVSQQRIVMQRSESQETQKYLVKKGRKAFLLTVCGAPISRTPAGSNPGCHLLGKLAQILGRMLDLTVAGE